MNKFLKSLKVPASEVLTVKTNLTRTEIISKVESSVFGPFQKIPLNQIRKPIFYGKVSRDGFEIYIIRGMIGQKGVVAGMMPLIITGLDETEPTHVKMTIGFANRDKILAKIINYFMLVFMAGLLFIPLLGLFYEHQNEIQSSLNSEHSVSWSSYSEFLNEAFRGLYFRLLLYYFGTIFMLRFIFGTLPSLLMKRGMKQSTVLMQNFFDHLDDI